MEHLDNWFQQSAKGSKRAFYHFQHVASTIIHVGTRLITMDTERWPCDTMWCYFACLFVYWFTCYTDLFFFLTISSHIPSNPPWPISLSLSLYQVARIPATATYRPPAAAYIATKSSTTSVIVGRSLGSWCHILSIKATGSTPQCFFSPAVVGRRCLVPTAS